MVGLWRKQPGLIAGQQTLDTELVFPSGRQALIKALMNLGLSRPSRVAIPEFSSACVIASVGRVATPIPMTEVLSHQLKVDAILAYEQWGWPFSEQVLQQLDGLKTPIIFDAVDSADALQRLVPLSKGLPVVVSLSKCLGFAIGGVLHQFGHWQRRHDSEITLAQPSLNSVIELDIYKSYGNDIHCIQPLLGGDVLASLEQESELRRANLANVARDGLTVNWPTWMLDIISAKQGAPGIAPLMRGKSHEAKLEAVKNCEKLGISAQIYNFNWSGNPLRPAYEPCLAFPLHSELPWSESVSALLKQWCASDND
ncbi:hypothetical protein [Motilimonas pumila]|uniref:DegT/DnrJ/EryC1/StrS aminotransferase family protein n=1 Tax=Motilimonas pumila TaxID=2303987 RepID=A0A418YGL8_9GAMM|nr:hypothetical protein [Motilimonas pumila]RJG49005.1 hypothetical protein D1Z90_06445 [Motilimonas pumila]